jgi:hypothetical protein
MHHDNLRVITEIKAAIASTGVSGRIIGEEETSAIRYRVAEKYLGRSVWFSEQTLPENRASVHHDDAERRIGEYVGNAECILFYDSSFTDDDFGVLLANGADLTNLLDNCYLFPHYVTNRDLDYVLCATHSSVLVGLGAAIPFVRQLQSEYAPDRRESEG